MRQFRLRTVLALVAVIALSIWVGMRIERARSARRVLRYTVVKPVYTTHYRHTVTRKYTVMRPVRETRLRRVEATNTDGH